MRHVIADTIVREYDLADPADDGLRPEAFTLAGAVLSALQSAGYMVQHVNDDWREAVSSREALRSELIRQHLAGECRG